MPSLTDIGATLQLPYSEVVKIAEEQVVNPNSQLYKSIATKLGQKLQAAKAAQNTQSMRAKPRVYVQHAVPAQQRFTLMKLFPAYNIKFSTVDVRAAAFARAMYLLTAEEMLSSIPHKKGRVLAFGMGLKQIVMRNRSWMHLCVPGHDADVQAELLREDRAIVAMVDSSIKRGQQPTLARAYVEGKTTVHCTEPHKCELKARVAVLDLSRTDTNFRQLAVYADRHGIEYMMFSLPGNKHMEMGTAGEFPELDAYVFPTEGGKNIHIAYKNDSSMDMAYTYSNYLELVARTQVVVNGKCYHKEFVGRVHGVLRYKVTVFSKDHADETPNYYKSWIDPNYRDNYMVYAPLLRPGGNVNNPDDFDLVASTVHKDAVDTVYDHAMRVQGVKDMAREIERRLYSRTSNYVLMNQIIHSNTELTINEFDMVALVIYCVTYMQKFKDGTAVSTLAPQARGAALLAKSSMPSLLVLYLQMVASKAYAPVEALKAGVRNAYYRFFTMGEMPMPSFTVAPGYVEYSDAGSSNPRFKGWTVPDSGPLHGFTTALPGFDPRILGKVQFQTKYETAPSSPPSAWAFATGEAYHDADTGNGVYRQQEASNWLQSAVSTITSIISEIPSSVLDAESAALVVQRSLYEKQHSTTQPEFGIEKDGFNRSIGPIVRTIDVVEDAVDDSRNRAVFLEAQRSKPRHKTPQVAELVDSIIRDHGMLRPGHTVEGVQHVYAADNTLPLPVGGSVSADPVTDIRSALTEIFPGSTAMNTQSFEADKATGPLQVVIKGIRTKIDLSGITGIKPEQIYRPKVNSHVQPNVKNNFVNTLQTIEKRNANAPADADTMDIDELYARAMDAAYKVYYVPGARERLAAMPYIGVTKQHVEEWVSRLDSKKIDKLIKESQVNGFDFMSLVPGAQDNQFMLKGKIKPKLDSSYSTAMATPQSIQYDQSGKLVAVYSPLYAQKVMREQSLLRPNVLVLQYKSKDDVDKFLNQFDHRPNERGKRMYLEGDYSLFDKSQTMAIAGMHFRKCVEFGFLLQYSEFYEIITTSRTVSSVKAKLKQWLDFLNASGFSNTLDRNNDANMLAMVELLVKIADKIEFMIFMGDDFVVAFRGDIDLTGWEFEINRKYNLNVKLSVHEHGYICSMDIVHLPDGKSRVVSDVVKRALMLTQQSFGEETPFEEMHTSYADITDGVQDRNVQQYLANAVTMRMRTYLPTVTPDAILLLCRAHARLRQDYEAFRGMFAAETTVRYY